MKTASLRSHPSHTILLVTPGYVARLDYVGFRTKRLKACWSYTLSTSEVSREPAREDPSLSNAIIQAIRLGPKRLGKVSVVSSYFWTEILELGADVVALASPMEVCQALAMEAEFESGLPSLDSVVAYHQVPRQDNRTYQFCTTQISNSQVHELRRLLSSQGASLYRLAHPIALKIRESEFTAEELNRELRMGRDSWFSELSETGPLDRNGLEELAVTCGELLVHRVAPALWIQPQQSIQPLALLTLSAALAVVTTMCCAAWNVHSRSNIVAKTITLEQLQELQSKQIEITSELKRTESRLVKLRKEAQSAKDSRQSAEHRSRLVSVFHQRNNSRWGRLLDALSTTSDDCWIRRIESNTQFTTLHGIAPDTAQAHSFAARLENALIGSGWIVEPAATIRTQSELSEFSITLSMESSGAESIESYQTMVHDPAVACGIEQALATNWEAAL